MSASKEDDLNQSVDYEEFEGLTANEDATHEINTESSITIQSSTSTNKQSISQQPCRSSSSSVSQVQNMNLSLGKSLTSLEKTSIDDSSNKSKIVMSTSKTSSIPGPVGLLPILTTNEDLRRLKEDKTAREVLQTNEENINGKRSKTSSDLFSLNIKNYPSYAIALNQLQETFGCEPISIHTALVKARLGIKKRIPLMCTAVTHYDRQENTILLDKSGHIRATFIGDDELLDNFNIRIGHTLVLRNVAVFTSTRHRHHYVNIHLQNIIAIQDPLSDIFNMPSMSQEYQHQEKVPKSILCSIENEICAYEDSSKANNETFHLFSQSDHDDDGQPPLKKSNTNCKASSSGFNQIKTKVAPSANKFKETAVQNPPTAFKAPQTVSLPAVVKLASTAVTVVTPPSSIVQADNQIDADISSEDYNDELFSVW